MSASLRNQPLSMGLVIEKNSKAKTVADIKGNKIGVSTNASLSCSAGARKLSELQGWGPNGVQTVPLGRAAEQYRCASGQARWKALSSPRRSGTSFSARMKAGCCSGSENYIGKFYTTSSSPRTRSSKQTRIW